MQISLACIYTCISTIFYVIVLAITIYLVHEIRAIYTEFNDLRRQRIMSAEEFWDNIRRLTAGGLNNVSEEDLEELQGETSSHDNQIQNADSALGEVKTHGSQTTSYKEEIIASNYINRIENGPTPSQEKTESLEQSSKKKTKMTIRNSGVEQKSFINNDNKDEIKRKKQSSKTNLKDYISAKKTRQKPKNYGKRVEGGGQGESQNADIVQNEDKRKGGSPNTSEECKKRKDKDKLNTLVIVGEDGKFIECFQFRESDYEDALKKFSLSDKSKNQKKDESNKDESQK